MRFYKKVKIHGTTPSEEKRAKQEIILAALAEKPRTVREIAQDLGYGIDYTQRIFAALKRRGEIEIQSRTRVTFEANAYSVVDPNSPGGIHLLDTDETLRRQPFRMPQHTELHRAFFGNL